MNNSLGAHIKLHITLRWVDIRLNSWYFCCCDNGECVSSRRWELDEDVIFRSPTFWERISYLPRALKNFLYSNIHMAKATLEVLDLMFVRRIEAGLLPPDHPWLTGIVPGTDQSVWSRNIVFASKRGEAWHTAPEDDNLIVERIGRFLMTMVRRSNTVEPEIPQGKMRRMPHAVNYIHGAVHYNGGFLIFDNFRDAMRHFSNRGFVAEFKRFARTQRRELTVVLRERHYDPTEFAWFLGFIRAHQPWYANANGPSSKRVLHGTPSPYPTINPINGSWVKDIRALYRGEIENLLEPPFDGPDFFKGVYIGTQTSYTFVEKFLVWAQHLVVRAKGFQGGLVFTKRKQVEPENWKKFQETKGGWRPSYPVPSPFRQSRANSLPDLKDTKDDAQN